MEEDDSESMTSYADDCCESIGHTNQLQTVEVVSGTTENVMHTFTVMSKAYSMIFPVSYTFEGSLQNKYLFFFRIDQKRM